MKAAGAWIMAGIMTGSAAVFGADGPPREWGETHRGVAASLRTETPSARVGEPLRFRVDVHNPGREALQFPFMGRFEAWRLQFLDDTGRRYEYSYFARDARPRPLALGPGETGSVALPVMVSDVTGRFRPVAGLTELPPGKYRVWAFYPFGAAESRDVLRVVPVETEGVDRLMTPPIEIEIRGEEEEAGWTRLGNEVHRQQYRRQAGSETVFTGVLEGRPPPRGASTLMRDHGYRLGDRLIPGRHYAELDALVGTRIELRGKAVDMTLEGVALREIYPAAVRPAAD